MSTLGQARCAEYTPRSPRRGIYSTTRFAFSKTGLAIFDVLDTFFNDPSFYGCLFINAAGEFPDPNDPAHKAAATHKKRAREDFLALAQKAGFRDAEGFTDVYTTLFEGTLIMRHVHGRNDAAKSMRPIVEQLIRQHTTS